eukprot:CAMPEP_0206620244 /NCGR_PEP_ID=MMETSP0325_2-20121206/61474_1 /ASSEMBLY_ACC=CAM_ASM_000347 /TAXON_ID=2866 /ORGANISM="Crypthecodinium cohnii, Strain Seligo" /LENGTH=374 /DNA_ID=CAMNT_0054143099 /DNA_START=247 /DNA_END=1371 /DNA_ORIENTATION=+
MSMPMVPVPNIDAEARAKLHVRKEDVPELHKTRLCRYAQKGHCKHGSSCTFAHTRDELTTVPDFTNTKICTSVVRGRQCTHKDCPFAHSYNELRPHPRPGGLGSRRKGQPAREKQQQQQQQLPQQQQPQQRNRVSATASPPALSGSSVSVNSMDLINQPSWEGLATRSPPGLSMPSATCGMPSQMLDKSWEGSTDDDESRDAFLDDYNPGTFAPDVVNDRDSAIGGFSADYVIGSYESKQLTQMSPEIGYADDWMKAACAPVPTAGSIHSTNASWRNLDESHSLGATITPKGNMCLQQESPTLESCRTMSWTHRSTHTGSDLTPTSVRSPTSSNSRRQLNKEDSGVVAAQIQELKSMLSLMSMHDEAMIMRLED